MNKIFLNNQVIKSIIDECIASNIDIYAVGGCVRDTLIGKEYKDADFAINATPEKTQEILKKLNIKYSSYGIKYGSIAIVVDNKTCHITSFREDTASYGRHADIKFTDSIEVDAKRRDFTFNAIYYDFKNDKIIDLYNGKKDLEAGEVKFIGDPEVRIKEDYLRILRYFRFFANYGKKLPSNDIIQAVKKHANSLKTISPQRKTQEIQSLLEAKETYKTLEIMNEAAVLEALEINDITKKIDLLTGSDEKFIVINKNPNTNFVLTREQSNIIRFLNEKDPLELVLVDEKFRLKLLRLCRYFALTQHCAVLEKLPLCPADLTLIQKAGFQGAEMNTMLHQARKWCMGEMLKGRVPKQSEILILLSQAKSINK